MRQWMAERRHTRYGDVHDAARAANVSVRLLWEIEADGTTSPEIAGRIGAAYGMNAAEIGMITNPDTAARRALEASLGPAKLKRLWVSGMYVGGAGS